jgi:hypothetical protein
LRRSAARRAGVEIAGAVYLPALAVEPEHFFFSVKKVAFYYSSPLE